ncbi:MAG: HDOD domain-containing protein [Desulfobacteraceae bacterium]|nr:HDOD domain-containing protein [Desulfobacteraceae bacterium]
MEKTSTHNLVPGMVLARDVMDQTGRLLAPSGQEITEKLIRIFKIWGVGEVRVKAPEDGDIPADTEPPVPEQIRKKAEELVGYRFQYNDLNDPFVYELFQLSSARKARRMLNNPDHAGPAEMMLTRSQDDAGKPAVSGRGKINVENLIFRTLRLGTLPDIYYKTIAAINNPETSLDDIAAIVSKDTTLSARVLQLVNSSFYSLRQKVDTLTWALALIGTNQLMTIVSGVSAVSLFKNIPSRLINMASFWEHSIACGTAARLLASYFPQRIEAERFFVSGLLHDIGRLILIQNLPEQYHDIFRRVRKEEIFLFTAEEEKFGSDHSYVGARLAHQWNLPEKLVNMIRYHHFPAQEDSFDEPAIVNLADILVNALEIGNSGEFFVPVIEPDVCRKLNLDKEMLQWVVNEIDFQLADIFEIIYGTSEA